MFFEDMSDPYLKGNKAGNRPPYYCLEDTSTGICWMIPLSSQINKYKRIMEKKKKQETLAYELCYPQLVGTITLNGGRRPSKNIYAVLKTMFYRSGGIMFLSL